MSVRSSNSVTTRRIAAGIAAVVVLDVAWVHAPFLLMFAIPFVVIALRYRGEHAVSGIAVIAFAALYAIIGASFALSSGLHYHEPGEPTRLLNPGEFAFAYIGTPLAVWLVVQTVRTGFRRANRLESAVA